LRKQIMRIVTDPTPVEEPKDPDQCNVFQIYRLFLDREEQDALRKRYIAGGLSYGEVKQELFETVRDYFIPFTERRNAILEDKETLHKTLEMGAQKARYAASKVMRKIRKKGGLAY
jgi:tryptophanyl-tRNA synthetase